jgi:hypothetical protein
MVRKPSSIEIKVITDSQYISENAAMFRYQHKIWHEDSFHSAKRDMLVLLLAPWMIACSSARASAEAPKTSRLIELARQQFGALTQAEEKLFRGAARGDSVDYNDGSKEKNDPNGSEAWGPDRVLKADRIVWLCTDEEASRGLTFRGLHIKGARIEGELALEYSIVPFPLRLICCAIPGGMNIQHAELAMLHLDGTHIGPIKGDGLTVKGDVFLRRSFRATGPVALRRASVHGTLDCTGGHFLFASGDALDCDKVQSGSAVFLSDGFLARGTVILRGAAIRGQLNCSGGKFRKSLNCDGMTVDGDVLLREGFAAMGEVRLRGAKIGGDLGCHKAVLANSKAYALVGDAMQVKGSVFMCEGFRAEGEVRLDGAVLGGQFSCTDAQFINPRGYALGADGISVAGDLFMRGNFRADGKISLRNARIDRNLVLGGRADAWKPTMLDLRSATAGTLSDDPNTWSQKGNLWINGFVYHAISDDAPKDPRKRLIWLRLQTGFSPLPYEQFASFLRSVGDDEAAKDILFAKNKDKAQLTKLSLSEWWWYKVFGRLIGYGYKPWRAFWIGLLIIVLGAVFFHGGWVAGVMSPTDKDAYASTHSEGNRSYSHDYPKFCSLVYSLEVFVPVIDLCQARYWLPNANKTGGLAPKSRWAFSISGRHLRWWFWFQRLVGWVLTTLFVVGLTGLIRT